MKLLRLLLLFVGSLFMTESSAGAAEVLLQLSTAEIAKVRVGAQAVPSSVCET